MSFENLTIGRLIIHEVFRRNVDRAIVDPTYGSQLIVLPQEAKDELQGRITQALGKSSHGVEMAFQDTGLESTWLKAKNIVEAQGNNALFIELSQQIAAKLAAAQSNRNIPGGIVAVIEGTCGNPAKSFMCIIKAEPHGGFTKRQANGHLTLEFIRELFLTPQAKLYKIGAFLCDDPGAATAQAPAAGWKAFLFDDLITQGNKLAAAQYFYETFLGLVFPSNSAFQTKQFHALTKDFIRTAPVPPEKKVRTRLRSTRALTRSSKCLSWTRRAAKLMTLTRLSSVATACSLSPRSLRSRVLRGAICCSRRPGCTPLRRCKVASRA